jgi:hypothetical protein
MGTGLGDPFTAVDVKRKIERRQALMRAQVVIRTAWIPLLAGGLLALYAPNTLVFALASILFIGALVVQTVASVRVFHLSRNTN